MNNCKFKNINVPRYWYQLSYTNENRVPPAEDPKASSWPTYFLKKDEHGAFTDNYGNILAFKIRQPDSSIDFEGKQLNEVKKTLKCLTPRQKRIAKYWGTGPATKQWTPIIDILIDTYKITAPKAARILAATQGALNDAFVIAWHFKFAWNIARPNQLDQELVSYLPTPNHPSYPSGHATIAGCAQIVLSYFFQSEKERLKELAEECAVSRLYAGVHFPIDNTEGLKLGRQIGKIVVNELEKQYDADLAHIDYPITENYHAKLPPPPYRQVIPCDKGNCCNNWNGSHESYDNCNEKVFKKPIQEAIKDFIEGCNDVDIEDFVEKPLDDNEEESSEIW
ncbi:hypothetical protein SH2C18_38670 [Clostridium sediminicola]|uniref:vanadium-dependent haloperoxidase n=1 Tax=Clostridium sediminicola TaxID=3114879 RepID=UPI0031F24220